MSQVLTESAKQLLREPVLAHIATIDAKGRPSISPVWVDVEGDDVVFNTAERRVKTRNLRSNPNVAVSVVDPKDPYRVLALRGAVIEMTHDGADEHIDFLANKYLGVEKFGDRREGQQRVKVRIRPEQIAMQPE
ncbi:MAG: PPOX class F420-dependent oxidoreductase [Acidimicrobiales bacterium]